MVVNGIKVEGTPKEVAVKIKGEEVKLTLVHIADADVIEAQFTWNEAPEGITLESKKVGNRVATTIMKDKKVIFEALTAQSTFIVLNKVFGWTMSKADSVYKKSNPLRKESKAGAGASKVVIAEAGVF